MPRLNAAALASRPDLDASSRASRNANGALLLLKYTPSPAGGNGRRRGMGAGGGAAAPARQPRGHWAAPPGAPAPHGATAGSARADCGRGRGGGGGVRVKPRRAGGPACQGRGGKLHARAPRARTSPRLPGGHPPSAMQPQNTPSGLMPRAPDAAWVRAQFLAGCAAVCVSGFFSGAPASARGAAGARGAAARAGLCCHHWEIAEGIFRGSVGRWRGPLRFASPTAGGVRVWVSNGRVGPETVDWDAHGRWEIDAGMVWALRGADFVCRLEVRPPPSREVRLGRPARPTPAVPSSSGGRGRLPLAIPGLAWRGTREPGPGGAPGRGRRAWFSRECPARYLDHAWRSTHAQRAACAHSVACTGVS